MKKLLAFSLIFCLLIVSGCNTKEKKHSETNDSFISLSHANIYTLDFNDLYKQIANIVNAEDDMIAMPFMYEKPAIDMIFKPDGEIMQFDLMIRALEQTNDNDYIIGTFRVRNNLHTDSQYMQSLPEVFSAGSSTMTGLDVYSQESGSNFAISYFKDTFDFDRIPKFMKWLTEFDLKSVINQYVTGEPVRFQFLSDSIKSSILYDPNVHVTYLDCSKDQILEVERPSLSDDPAPQYAVFPNKYYYVIVPYYLQDGTIKGFDEKTLGQTKPKTYIANNVIILMQDK